MARLRYSKKRAVEHLSKRDKQLGRYITDIGRCTIVRPSNVSIFTALTRSIVYQQLSGKAAATIYGRFEALFPERQVDPERLVNFSIAELRGVGLSNNKALSVLDLAEKTLSGQLASRHQIARMDDQRVIDNLVQVRGIGPWTVQMLLMFYLGRPDVMPGADLGIQKGLRVLYDLPDLPKPEEVLEQTEHLSPFRTVAAWYLWRIADVYTLS